MQTLKLTKDIDKNGHLYLDLPTGSPGKRVELVVVINEVPPERKIPHYNFEDLSGKLRWKGDPVKMQRKIRSEWQ